MSTQPTCAQDAFSVEALPTVPTKPAKSKAAAKSKGSKRTQVNPAQIAVNKGTEQQEEQMIQGVCTAGTVRVNNLANIEALLNILATGGEVLGFIVGGILLVRIGKVEQEKLLGRVGLIAMIMGGGYLLPGAMNFAVAAARDANLFS